MKLLKVRHPKASCIDSICSSGEVTWENSSDRKIRELCRLFSAAKTLHEDWKNSKSDRCISEDGEMVSEAYLLFLRTASDWLARGTTEKNVYLISAGAFLICCTTVIFLGILVWVNWKEGFASNKWTFLSFRLENWVAVIGVCGHAVSFNSSSLVEEEHFTLHFLVVTLWCLILRRCFQKWDHQNSSCHNCKLLCDLLPSSGRCLNKEIVDAHTSSVSGHQRKPLILAFIGMFLLVSARTLRAWHRGGVNWAHLPDIVKQLEQSGLSTLLSSHVLSLCLVAILCCHLVLEQRPYNSMQKVVVGIFLSTAMLIEWYTIRTRGSTVGHNNRSSLFMAQLVYTLLGGTSLAVLILAPYLSNKSPSHSESPIMGKNTFEDWQGCTNFIGKVSISCWCFLQLLLQQPVNSIPILLLLVQLIFCLAFFKLSGSSFDLWLKILILYLMGASGHFGLGNTNTLATVDVAGAYIGLSKHSIFLSGVLAFIITYAAPLLYMLGTLVMISLNEVGGDLMDTYGRGYWLLEATIFSCNLPLLLSSVVLMSFTFVMLLMQGHLFIWSVFSPKYIYICFTVFSTYLGVLFNAIALLHTSVVLLK